VCVCLNTVLRFSESYIPSASASAAASASAVAVGAETIRVTSCCDGQYILQYILSETENRVLFRINI
jgi:hypothetical protein